MSGFADLGVSAVFGVFESQLSESVRQGKSLCVSS